MGNNVGNVENLEDLSNKSQKELQDEIFNDIEELYEEVGADNEKKATLNIKIFQRDFREYIDGTKQEEGSPAIEAYIKYAGGVNNEVILIDDDGNAILTLPSIYNKVNIDFEKLGEDGISSKIEKITQYNSEFASSISKDSSDLVNEIGDNTVIESVSKAWEEAYKKIDEYFGITPKKDETVESEKDEEDEHPNDFNEEDWN